MQLLKKHMVVQRKFTGWKCLLVKNLMMYTVLILGFPKRR